jgi:hypothetical protein
MERHMVENPIMAYYLAIKRLIDTFKHVEKSQILEERSQDQNFIYYMIPFV